VTPASVIKVVFERIKKNGSSDFLAQNALSIPPQTTPLSRMGLIVSDLAPFLLKEEGLGLGLMLKSQKSPKKGCFEDETALERLNFILNALLIDS
jgi:hypothetical protein